MRAGATAVAVALSTVLNTLFFFFLAPLSFPLYFSRLYLSVHPFCVPIEMNAFSSNSATLARSLTFSFPLNRFLALNSSDLLEEEREGERTKATIGKCVWCWKMNYAKYHVVMLCVNT